VTTPERTTYRPATDDDLTTVAEVICAYLGCASFDHPETWDEALALARRIAREDEWKVEVDHYGKGSSASRIVHPWGKDQ